MVRLRLKRHGRRNRPFYRINAMDQRAARDSRPIEELGWYDPMATDDAKRFHFKEDRVKYWLGVGAQPTRTVRDILRKAGVVEK
ncbi:MAG: 30S ribosomal protein S16 [Phycisphaeraceae bacterium]